MIQDQVPSQSELENAHCWFPKTDRAAGRPDITAFKQRARLHQAHWRERNGYVRGSHLSRDGKAVENGSKMAPDGPIEKDFRNFLDSEAIRAAVHDRLRPETKKQERGQQVREDRLRYDLLSSMPMCFNLFGELCGDRDRLTGAGKKLFGIAQPGVEVRFEHSPGRQTMDYTNDGTAFDAALFFGEAAGPRTTIGIETKYHEHALRELKPDTLSTKRPVIRPEKRKMPRYETIVESARKQGVFKDNWRDLLGTELQQIWRDHLLLLSMLLHKNGSVWGQGRYILVHPAKNPSFGEAGKRYRKEFLDNDETFDVMTIEELLEAGVLHDPTTTAEFEKRYMW